MTILALDSSTMWTIGLLIGISQFVLNIVFVIVMASVSRKTNRIDNLEAKVEASARALVDSRMEANSNQFLGVMDVLKERIDQIVDRLTAGDKDFKDLNDRDHQLELKFQSRIESLKDWMRDTFASKHHAEAMQRQIDHLNRTTGSK